MVLTKVAYLLEKLGLKPELKFFVLKKLDTPKLYCTFAIEMTA
jgi:hypothetical protein